MSRSKVSILLIASALLVGCVSRPPDSAELSEVVASDTRVSRPETQVLAVDSTQRYAREVTYRVRNLSCAGVASGSAFAVSPNLLVTNSHVVEGAVTTLELSTWDGRDLSVDVFQTAVVADLAFLQTKQKLPVVARLENQPALGEPVAAVGYPLGGPWTLSQGAVVDYVDGSTYGVYHDVIVFDAYVAPGNSGGPLFNRDGAVVGVVFAKESVGEMRGLAIPINMIGDVLRTGSLLTPQPGC